MTAGPVDHATVAPNRLAPQEVGDLRFRAAPRIDLLRGEPPEVVEEMAAARAEDRRGRRLAPVVACPDQDHRPPVALREEPSER
jgi:hypothetical protein